MSLTKVKIEEMCARLEDMPEFSPEDISALSASALSALDAQGGAVAWKKVSRAGIVKYLDYDPTPYPEDMIGDCTLTPLRRATGCVYPRDRGVWREEQKAGADGGDSQGVHLRGGGAARSVPGACRSATYGPRTQPTGVVAVVKVKKVLEGYTQGKVVAWARHDLGLLACKLSTIAQRSFPDFCFFIPGGRPLLIEFKATGKKATKSQTQIHEELIHEGYDVAVCDSIASAKDCILRACIRATIDDAPRNVDFLAELGRLGNVRGAGAVVAPRVHARGRKVGGATPGRGDPARPGHGKNVNPARGVLRSAKGARRKVKGAGV